MSQRPYLPVPGGLTPSRPEPPVRVSHRDFRFADREPACSERLCARQDPKRIRNVRRQDTIIVAEPAGVHVLTNLRDGTGLPAVIAWLCQHVDTYLAREQA